ncbi:MULTISPECIES: phosphopantetheine-binding protein [unclassified Streptomyces]|uniref:phosphopantetheine-binding protein n=1 Tax=unclassified Streptomyces TaxID=2593676 RepID=UPI003650EFC9
MSQTTTTAAPTADEIRDAVAELIGFHARDIADDANLIALGLKSLHIMQLINGWRRAGLTASFKDLAGEPTVAAWVRQLAS